MDLELIEIIRKINSYLSKNFECELELVDLENNNLNQEIINELKKHKKIKSIEINQQYWFTLESLPYCLKLKSSDSKLHSTDLAKIEDILILFIKNHSKLLENREENKSISSKLLEQIHSSKIIQFKKNSISHVFRDELKKNIPSTLLIGNSETPFYEFALELHTKTNRKHFVVWDAIKVDNALTTQALVELGPTTIFIEDLSQLRFSEQYVLEFYLKFICSDDTPTIIASMTRHQELLVGTQIRQSLVSCFTKVIIDDIKPKQKLLQIVTEHLRALQNLKPLTVN